MRIALGIEYHGTFFHGWQAQIGLRTVQDSLQQALSKMANHPVALTVAGRTDAGVHALGQVVHFNTDTQRDLHAWVRGTNAYLSHDLKVHWAQEVPDNFHARYSATARRYCYIIENRPNRPALLRDMTCWYYLPLDLTCMQQAAAYLVGQHDFSSFRDSDCQAKSPIRIIHHINIVQQNTRFIVDIKANAFLHHMVRNIMGVLLDVGSGKQEPQWVAEVLAAKTRIAGGKTASAKGLYLMEVDYPSELSIPQMGFDLCWW